jgi:hypothetical protein
MLTFSIDESITGDALVALLHSDLEDMGVASIGHRLKILKSVYDLKVKHNITIEPDHFIPLCMFNTPVLLIVLIQCSCQS